MSRSAFHRFRVLAVSLLLVGAGAVLHASCENVTPRSQAAPNNQKPEEMNAPLAKIDDVTITVGDFQNRINQQSPYVRARYTSLERKREFLDNLVRFEVLAHEARSRGLDKDEEVIRTMKQVMIQKLMKDEMDKLKIDDISDGECKTYFEAHLEEFNKPEEVRVAHILVKDDKTAKRVLADPRVKAQDGETFRKLVSEFSTDAATKERGGDLRYFDATTKDLPQEIVKASFALTNVGDVSPPVHTAAGVHILKLTGRRKALVRSLDDVKSLIKTNLYKSRRQATMEDFVKNLRAKSKVEVHEDRLAKVQIDSAPPGSFTGPGLPPPGPGMFHPGAPGAPQAGPAMPGMPVGSPQIPMPPMPPAAPPPPATDDKSAR